MITRAIVMAAAWVPKVNQLTKEITEMKKQFFNKLSNNLAEKYTKGELATKLVERKAKRVSNLLASAYNKKVLGTGERATEYFLPPNFDVFDRQAIEYFKMKERSIGPGSWIYEILQEANEYKGKKSWHRFLESIDFVSLDDPDTLSRIFEYACNEALEIL